MSQAFPKPYVPLSCEEVSLVEDLDHWTNRQVRIFGKIRTRDLQSSIALLQSLGEKDSVDIKIDFR